MLASSALARVEDVLLAREANTVAYPGRLEKARELSRRAVASAERAKENEVAAMNEGNAALREALFGNAAEGRQRSGAALALSNGRNVQVLAALALAFAGDARRAQVLTDDLDTRFPESTVVRLYFLSSIRGQLERIRNDPFKAIETLQSAAPYELGSPVAVGLYPVYVRGEAYLAAHRGLEAAGEFEKIIPHRSVVPICCGWPVFRPAMMPGSLQADMTFMDSCTIHLLGCISVPAFSWRGHYGREGTHGQPGYHRRGLTIVKPANLPPSPQEPVRRMELDAITGKSRPAERMKQSKIATTANTVSKQAPMHRVIYDALLAEIQQGQYRSGERLPSELELCKRFQSSRITVAKAINSLQHAGLVVRRAGSGSYVQLAAPVTSFQFGLLIPELGSTEIFEPICQGIMQSPQAKSHSLIWGHTSLNGSSKEEAALSLCRQFIEQKVSGVFFAPLEFVDKKDSINHQLVAELRQAAIPIVLLDRCYYPYPMRSNLDRVGIDNHRASFVVTQHLWNQGARRIVFVARKRSASTIVDRVSGYQFALGECGSPFPARALFGDVEDREFVRELVEEVKPDGVVCGNDLTAARLMQALIGLGVRVPEQVRLVSFDDVSYAKFLPVPLTTIHQNCSQIGEVAMEMMLDRIQHPHRPGMDLLVPFELVVRESCGPAREATCRSGSERRASVSAPPAGTRRSTKNHA